MRILAVLICVLLFTATSHARWFETTDVEKARPFMRIIARHVMALMQKVINIGQCQPLKGTTLHHL